MPPWSDNSHLNLETKLGTGRKLECQTLAPVAVRLELGLVPSAESQLPNKPLGKEEDSLSVLLRGDLHPGLGTQ